MVDAQSRIFLPMLTEIVPEGVNAFARIASPQGIHPSLCQQAPIALASRRLEKRVLQPGTRVINIVIGWHHVVFARQYYGMVALVEACGVLNQSFEPGQFVVEFGTRLRVAVR